MLYRYTVLQSIDMSKRRYNQFCPLAYALDVVGDRWTLLVVRELLLGPRRFKDLQTGLPGMGTNLLSDRLKTLEVSGVIVHRKLPPPAGAAVYELTGYGRGLQPTVEALSMWGMQLLPPQLPADDYIGVVPALCALRVLPRKPSPDAVLEFHMDDEVRRVALSDGEIIIDADTPPTATFALQPRLLLELIAGQTAISAALAQGSLQIIHGEVAILNAFIDAFEVQAT